MRALRRLELGRTRGLLVVALVVQAGYLAYQLQLFTDDLHKAGPSRDAYESVSFTLLGAHHAHVLVGVLLTTWMLGKLVLGPTGYRLTALRAIALYWHVVNVLGLVVTGVILSGRA